jgi:predicted RNA-binding protein with PIN domain
MILILDAYNILKQVYSVKHIAQGDQQKFIKQVAQLTNKRGFSAYIVFDGGPSSYETVTHVGAVSVIYAGAGYSADGVIMRLLQEQKKLDPVLVTDDREIRNKAKELQLVSLKTYEFLTCLKTITEPAKKNNHKIQVVLGECLKSYHKFDAHNPVDQLMLGLGDACVNKEEQEDGPVFMMPSQKLKKGDKKRQQVIDKLCGR